MQLQNWPLPPFFRDERSGSEEPPEAMLFMQDGAALHGRLTRFAPETLSLQLVLRGQQVEQTIRFAEIKSLQLIAPVALAVDITVVEHYLKAGGQLSALEPRTFAVHFLDKERLNGTTKGFVRTRSGLFIFLTTTGERVVRIFIPMTALADFQVGGLLGQHLVDHGFVKPEHLAQALEEQARRRQQDVDEHLGDAPGQDVQALASQLGQVGSIASTHLGDILVTQGLVTREQMVEAMTRMRGSKSNLLGNVLVEMGALDRQRLTQAVAEQLNIPLVNLREFTIHPDVLALVGREFAMEHQVLPLLVTPRSLVIAVESPVDADYLDDLRFKTQRQVIPVIASSDDLKERIEHEYPSDATHGDFQTIPAEIEQLSKNLESESASPGQDAMHRQVSDEDTLVVRTINQMILDAQRQGASDIHVEAYPGEQDTRIRFRVDGSLADYLRVPHVMRAAMVSRLKIMANLDISEHRLPQDGKIDFSHFAATKLELRVACLPTANGLQDVVLRLLASSKPIPLEQMGMDADLIRQLKAMVHRSYGLFLVCGPTGSGKTTTLHSLMAEINTPDNKIWTAEDPIEITHPGLRQIQMIPRIGLTFATAMRAFLRADPDIIMVGEIRDLETADIAIKAAQTGHLVLSTLHTNDAPTTLTRMRNMGIAPFNIASSVILITAQRLARRLCSNCKAPAEIPKKTMLDAGFQPDELDGSWVNYRPVGCSSCNNGYKGRVGIYQVMPITEELQRIILRDGSALEIAKQAQAEGVRSLRQSGLHKVKQGLTSLEEVLAVTNE
ncbi:MAG: ATPase, T2SS/T4P/T4SS family [Hylemonella sp.]|nr:ATPase, T2SS/T4P/T4SS family [Hylemonella sp.]